MIEVKEEFNNGLFDCQRIFDNDFKILEKTNNKLWNTNENHPICIAKSRKKDYVSSNVPAEKFADEQEEIQEQEDARRIAE